MRDVYLLIIALHAPNICGNGRSLPYKNKKVAAFCRCRGRRSAGGDGIPAEAPYTQGLRYHLLIFALPLTTPPGPPPATHRAGTWMAMVGPPPRSSRRQFGLPPL